MILAQVKYSFSKSKPTSSTCTLFNINDTPPPLLEIDNQVNHPFFKKIVPTSLNAIRLAEKTFVKHTAINKYLSNPSTPHWSRSLYQEAEKFIKETLPLSSPVVYYFVMFDSIDGSTIKPELLSVLNNFPRVLKP